MFENRKSVSSWLKLKMDAYVYQQGRSIGKCFASIRKNELWESKPDGNSQSLRSVKSRTGLLLPVQAGLVRDGNNPYGCSFNFYYYHLLMQVRLYYPNAEKKIASIFEQNYQLWKSAIQRAKEKGEIRQDVNVEETASVFWQVFFGFSFEQSFFQGVNIKQLEQKLHSIYSLLKAWNRAFNANLQPHIILVSSFNTTKPTDRFVFIFLFSIFVATILFSATWTMFKNREEMSCFTRSKRTVRTTYG